LDFAAIGLPEAAMFNLPHFAYFYPAACIVLGYYR
jgi:hypothetical protein